MATHEGHRERMRKQLKISGMDSFSDVQVLELLLYYAYARQDTNPIAHALLHRFGSLSGVLEAPVSELLKVPGVGPSAAELLALIPQLERRHLISRAGTQKILTSTALCGQYLVPFFHGAAEEQVYLLCLDAKCKVLDCILVQSGDVNSAGISVRKVIKAALAANATSVVLAHNHPSGVALPSEEDRQVTQIVKAALDAVDILLAALDNTEVPVSVYSNLIEAVHRNFDKLHRYTRLRKRLMGVDELHFYDLYTTLVPDADVSIPYEQAKQTISEALTCLGEEYGKLLRQGFDNRWIDVYENVGKRSGAYSAGARVHPFVLLNYTGTLDSQFTLAHEMGHALHSYLSNRTQPTIYQDYVIFVAEVASTCNEALLMQHLLKQTTDKRQRAYLINYFLEQFRTTLYRQTMFAEFELRMAELSREGQTLTAELLCEEYRKLNAAYYGEDIVLDPQIALEWARIPHFYYNYYVFQYATGYSAAIALSQRILAEGEPSVRDYLGFLSGGCSKTPIDLLRGAGVDMTTSAPVESALKLFGDLLDEMEALLL